MTEIADRTLRRGGPALLFENPRGYSTPVLVNLFGTEQRVALGMGGKIFPRCARSANCWPTCASPMRQSLCAMPGARRQC